MTILDETFEYTERMLSSPTIEDTRPHELESEEYEVLNRFKIFKAHALNDYGEVGWEIINIKEYEDKTTDNWRRKHIEIYLFKRSSRSKHFNKGVPDLSLSGSAAEGEAKQERDYWLNWDKYNEEEIDERDR